MRNANTIILRRLLGSISIVAIFSLLTRVGCDSEKAKNPMPGNPVFPTVVSTYPDNGAMTFARNQSLSTDFSTEMDAASIDA